jgi:lipopolysaccharide transport system ATP-binding protein
VQITSVALLGADGFERQQFASGEALTVRISYVSHLPPATVRMQVAIYAPDGTICLGVDTQASGVPFEALATPQSIDVRFDRLDLAGGEYFVTLGIFSEDWRVVLDYHSEAYPFTINSVVVSRGYLLPPMQWLKRERS